jgi:hypothetical protein
LTAPILGFADARELLTQVICGTYEVRHESQLSTAPAVELNRLEGHALMMSMASADITDQVWKGLYPHERV